MSETPLYQINGLIHRYHDQVVLDIDTLTIDAGTIVGLVGPNGSGKSTLLQLLGVTVKPSQGKILFQGNAVEPFRDEVRFNIALLPQEPYLLKRSVRRNIGYGLGLRGRTHDLDEMITKALGWVGLPAQIFAGRQWNELSGGETQRVALAARLALTPKVLLLDEPTANVDSRSSQLIKTAVIKVRERYGTTLVVASHDREWLDEICDHVICLFRGRITGRDRDNIIFGPWQLCGPEHCRKLLEDDQEMILPAPPSFQSAACIDPDAIVLATADASAVNQPHQPRVLKGSITRMGLTGGGKRMILSLRAGELSLAVRLDRQSVVGANLYPGQPVLIEIPKDAVTWIALDA